MIIYNNKIPSSYKAVDICVREILKLMEEHEPLKDEALQFKVSFVLRELMNNSVEHGNAFDSSKMIQCLVQYSEPLLMIEISDEGTGINRNEDYISSLSDEKRERRRGLKLIEDLDFMIELNKSTIRLNLNIS